MRKFFINIILLLAVFVSSAQNKQELPQRQVFIRGGVDLSRFLLPYLDDIEVKGFEASFDTELNHDLFPTIEYGQNYIDYNNKSYNYLANGTYFRVGLNYNMLNYQHRLDRNIFFIGARYAYSNYTHKANNVTIENDWGSYETSFPEEKLHLHWAEAVMGLRGEIFKNFYMGYTLRIKIKLSESDYSDMSPYFVPGFGKPTDIIKAGMSYSVFYAIPIKKITK